MIQQLGKIWRRQRSARWGHDYFSAPTQNLYAPTWYRQISAAVPGRHNTYHAEPHIRVYAEKLNACLNWAEQEA
ncbi:MAG: hypothetical protein KI793_08820 [Rivularia sp. (in: Bacteria)]|nr:hypothetical protein [Rivularia sp. MS3]